MEARVLRTKNVQIDVSQDVPEPPNKRRRAAFGNITNQESFPAVHDGKKKSVKKASSVITNENRKQPVEAKPKPTSNKPTAIVGPLKHCQVPVTKPPVAAAAATRQEQATARVAADSSSAHQQPATSKVTEDEEIIDLCTRFDWIDVDKDNKDSPYHITNYVNNIFDYYKSREAKFAVSDYLPRQTQLTSTMRAILVDWLVEVQQNFELHHETLYLSVALTDLYLTRKTVPKDRLQLLGATALLISSKFEEKSPPLVDDFVYICDDTYAREEVLEMERTVLKVIDFDIGVPLSYTFLRRYAQCARVSLTTLTLARYILESSLVEYTYVTQPSSIMAAASLLLAMRMNNDGDWDRTMVHYTGYEVATHLSKVARQLNQMVRKASSNSLKTVLTKYSHKVFHEVAKIAPLDDTRINLALPLGVLPTVARS